MPSNVRFYRLSSIPTFDAAVHEGVFVYMTATNDPTYTKGLWFGGSNSWELLTNVQGITLQDVMNWMDNQNNDYPFTGEADIFGTPTTSTTQGSIGTEYTIYDVILDSDGIRASSDSSDVHTFRVGDGALKIGGFGTTTVVDANTPSYNFPQVQAVDVHSADDKVDSTLSLDESLVWNPSGSGAPYGGTIGVRTKTPVANNNLIVTEQDILSINGAMHLIGTLSSSSDWPTTSNTHPGDTYIVTGGVAHTGPDGVVYEPGDTVVYYDTDGNGTMGYKVVNTNIRTGTEHGQHPMVDMPGGQGQLTAGKIVIATNGGITTSDAKIDNIVTDVTSTQTITATESNQLTTATYSVSTVVEKLDGGSDSDVDVHEISFHSLNESFKITEATGNDADNKINFDLVWLTTMV